MENLDDEHMARGTRCRVGSVICEPAGPLNRCPWWERSRSVADMLLLDRPWLARVWLSPHYDRISHPQVRWHLIFMPLSVPRIPPKSVVKITVADGTTPSIFRNNGRNIVGNEKRFVDQRARKGLLIRRPSAGKKAGEVLAGRRPWKIRRVSCAPEINAVLRRMAGGATSRVTARRFRRATLGTTATQSQ